MPQDSSFPDTAPSSLPEQSIDLAQTLNELVGDFGELLASPPEASRFLSRLDHLVDRMSFIMRSDIDGVLFVLLQRAQYELHQYSAAHAVTCAVLAKLCSRELRMRRTESGCLIGAALTMNIAMTALQDELALQTTPPTVEQRKLIQTHAVRARLQLASLGITNELWLDIISSHHEVADPLQGSAIEQPSIYLPRILGLIDRFVAGLTPRTSRTALTAMQFAEGVHNANSPGYDAAAAALVKAAGIFPPGTYVRLINNEIAVVLRRGAKANQPLVANVVASNGSASNRSRLIDTARQEFMVNGSVLAADLDIVRPDYAKLSRLLPKS